MEKLRVLSLFSGIGAFEKALTNLGIPYELVNYCEINEHASKCYSLIHGVSENLNLKDVTKICPTELADFDLLTHGLTGMLTCRNIQNYNKKFWYNNRLYKPSPRMCFRLMGFTDEDFDKIKDVGTDSQLWDRAGNSIVVNVVEAIFKNLFVV